MTILFKLDAQGGFTVADTVTRRTSYAYPASANASKAMERPNSVAAEMMTVENALGSWRDAGTYTGMDASRLADLSQ
jgi:hypothetical protein